MILTENLSKKFDNFLAVDNANLNVGKGEVLALLGPNGAGKTTTVRMLTSVLQPTGGRAWVAGYDVVEYPSKVRASVGVLTEHHGLYNRMSGADYLDFFGEVYGVKRTLRQERIRRLLDDFGLPYQTPQRIGEYSKGMRQKLALARALLHDPPVLLLDEPTSAMDPESARLVRDAMMALRSSERTIVICTHNLVEAEELADQIAIIRRGKIIAYGSPAALKASLLGPAEYEIKLATQLDGLKPRMSGDFTLTASGVNWFRYRTDQPNENNPRLLRELLDEGLPVIGLHEVPRSLEKVYLQAIISVDEQEATHA